MRPVLHAQARPFNQTMELWRVILTVRREVQKVIATKKTLARRKTVRARVNQRTILHRRKLMIDALASSLFI